MTIEPEEIDLSVLDQLPINSWAYPRVLVGIPKERALSHADLTFTNFMQISNQGPAMVDLKHGRIDVIRNQMALALLQSDYTHLLMLDFDHVHPIDIIQRLARWPLIYPDIKVVSGLNFRRGAPYDPVAGKEFAENGQRKILKHWPQGIVPMKEIGGASLLVERSVFEQLEPPWFFNIYDEVWKNSWPGEDIGFSRKCSAAGIQVYVDTTTSSPHITESLVTEETFRAYMEQFPEEAQ